MLAVPRFMLAPLPFLFLLFELAGIQMLWGGTGRLLHASFNGDTPALQIGGEFGLQFSQTLARTNFVGAASPVLRDRTWKKCMRGVFSSMWTIAETTSSAPTNSVRKALPPEESPGVFWRKALEKGAAIACCPHFVLFSVGKLPLYPVPVMTEPVEQRGRDGKNHARSSRASGSPCAGAH